MALCINVLSRSGLIVVESAYPSDAAVVATTNMIGNLRIKTLLRNSYFVLAMICYRENATAV